LKSRVKVVAGELKERRGECRDLKNKIDDLLQENEKLEDHIASLESQLSDRDRSRTEQDEEVDNLRSTIEQLKKKVEEAEEGKKAKEAEGEKALANYKKKAQNSLAVANARAAAAVQAKEEAEMEARAARSTADTAMQRASVAEVNGQEAMIKAKAYYKEMEEEKVKAVKELEVLRDELTKVQEKLEEITEQLQQSSSEKASIAAERSQLSRELEAERSKVNDLQRDLGAAQLRSSALLDDVSELREQLKRAEVAGAANSGEQKTAPKVANELSDDTSAERKSNSAEDSNAKETILMLQNQLSEANQAIEELRKALENAVEMSEKSAGDAGGSGVQSVNNSANSFSNGGGGESVPLFYAMEKQAELNTARNEINRLASLYADVQSEKVEAQEALGLVQKQLDEERAKLERYEKLGSAASAKHGAPDGSAAIRGQAQTANGQTPTQTDSGRMNIEYLKNVMLSFLNAKTLTERKALVPVIGAVLCLTADEQAAALQNVEATGGFEGVSSAIFESLGSRVHRKI
jgi:chromosome segregation ATPase